MVTSHTYTLTGDVDVFFTDSGPPASSSDYTTLIILHGTAFNGGSFEKLHNLAHDFNLRTVVLNRREYPGSSPYTDAEINDIHHGRKVALDRLAIQLGDFVRQFVEKNPGVPKIGPGRKSGGLAIMGWSMGCMTAMTLFADPRLFSEELYTLLAAYVKDLILDDPPHVAFGIPLPPNTNAYISWEDSESQTPQELFQNFCYWSSSYFSHPDFYGGSIEALDMRKRSDHATVMDWTAE
ncbi:hypothetical protein H0H92_010574 [Tricholoma furcatifolium]|nr:hypothetical protein H0H92_010574 [Tricholoma furcatifolium]